MTKENLIWFLIGTFAGWLVIFLAVTIGGAALTVVIGMLPIAVPVFTVIGIIWCIWYLTHH